MSTNPTRIAAITGANRGLGRAIAAGLAGGGLHVAICARDERAAQPDR
ncbi:SDR family NAD(P)-dependent oxidoreductase [Nonomuraea dietziae]